MSILSRERQEIVSTQEKVIILLRRAVWADLPWNEEGHPNLEQIENWKDLERREEAEEWFEEHGDDWRREGDDEDDECNS